MEPKVERHVLLRLIKALFEEEELSTVAEIISADPVLASKILRFVNSAYSNLRRTIHSIEDAVAYLGYQKLKEVAFTILVSSLITDKSPEEIKRFLEFAYLMKSTARRVAPKVQEEAFLVGILYPVYLQEGEKLLEMLEGIGVSKVVLEALKNPKSPLGVVREFAQKLTPLCLKLDKGEIKELPFKTASFKKEFIVKVCLEASVEAEKVLKLL
jgi:EAL and modified HD-GYP domain-containing signal transduction protein